LYLIRFQKRTDFDRAKKRKMFGKIAGISSIGAKEACIGTVSRGVTRSDGARGKKQVWRPHI